MDIARENTALLVIDMQNGFFDAKGSMAAVGMPYEELRPAIAGCRTLVGAARAAGVPVIYTRYVYHSDYADGGLLPTYFVPSMKEVGSLAEGSWDADIIDELAPAEGEIVIDKSRPSSFYGTRLEPVLTGLGVRSLVIAGVTTNICVESTARDAGQRDYRVHVISDATAEFEKSRHDHALNTIGFAFGWVNTVDDVVRAWS
ncbi:cysteine hydrolase family protein [Actinomadura sp. SCN-SB]|uniref:cysteine hydrolase family protein n=1 Tax=Actinomadura sp. SCN-SB TaxID=3373092 RepID=UPI0037512D4B